MIMPKTKGSGIMISDFIDRYGYLSLNDDKLQEPNCLIQQSSNKQDKEWNTVKTGGILGFFKIHETNRGSFNVGRSELP